MIDFFIFIFLYIPRIRKISIRTYIYTENNLDNINKTFPKLYGFTKYIYKPNQKTRRTR